MHSCMSSSVDVVKNVINKVTRSRVQYRSSAALALHVQEHIASLCHKRVPVCLDVFISCGCTSSSQELFYSSPTKSDSECNKKDAGSSGCGSVHVERWTCTFLNRRTTEGSVSDYDLLAAISDCLQRSQFSQWFRSHKGKKPYSIQYRLGAPDEVSDMSTTDVSFAQVFPVVHLDRNTCLQTAMASFFDPNASLLIGCKLCCIPGLYDHSRLLSTDHDNAANAATTNSSFSNVEIPGVSKLESMDTSQRQTPVDTSAILALSGSSRSNCSSRSESPASCSLQFSSLAFPIICGSTYKEPHRLPSVILGCADSTSQPRPLGEADLHTFLTEVRHQPLDESMTVLIDSPGSPEKLSFSNTVQNKQTPDEESSIRQQTSNGAIRPNCPVRVRSLPAKFPSRPSPLAADSHSQRLTSNEPNSVTGRSIATALSSAGYFNPLTGLPLHSSPAPLKRGGVRHFNFDPQLTSPRRIRSSVSGGELLSMDGHSGPTTECKIPSSAVSFPLLGTFEESLLNGRIMPVGAVDGFKADLAASGAFCAPHMTFPVGAYFFQLDEAAAPWSSPYLGVINLRQLGVTSSLSAHVSTGNITPKTRSRYYIPPRGTVQVTLFNPNRTVLKMFVVLYDLADMPPSSTTFIRQRTLYMPVINSEASSSAAITTSSIVGNNSASASAHVPSSRPDSKDSGRWNTSNSAGVIFAAHLVHLPNTK